MSPACLATIGIYHRGVMKVRQPINPHDSSHAAHCWIIGRNSLSDARVPCDAASVRAGLLWPLALISWPIVDIQLMWSWFFEREVGNCWALKDHPNNQVLSSLGANGIKSEITTAIICESWFVTFYITLQWDSVYI